MKMNFNLIKFDRVSIQTEQLIQHGYSLKQNQNRSSRGGSQLTATPCDVLQPLINQMTELCRQYNNQFDNMRSTQTHVQVKEVWYNINPKGSYNVAHTHGSIGISSVVWLQIESGAIEFYDLTGTASMLKCHDTLSHQPTNLDCCFFPSNYPHAVSINHSEQDRISIAINFGVE
jgi:hypothetical protein